MGLHGDAIGGPCAAPVRRFGVITGANIRNEQAVFEAVHRLAPDIAGQGIANPLALLMSAVMMFNHLASTCRDDGCRTVLARTKTAHDPALNDGQETRALGGELTTDQLADALIARLAAS